jgi:DNA polymerase-3 subunit delta
MIIFLHGDDTFRSREKLRELKQKFLREVDPSGLNLATIDGASATADEVWAAVAAQSFLVRKRMVVVEDLGAQKASTVRENVAALLDRIPEDVIVVFWESKSRKPEADSRKQRSKPTVRKRTSPAGGDTLFPRLLKEKFAQEFTPLQGRELEAWVRERAKFLGATIEPAAIRDLITVVGSDLWRMTNELEKLALATQAGIVRRGTASPLVSASSVGVVKRTTLPLDDTSRDAADRMTMPTITAAFVRSLVSDTPSDTPFAFLDAVGSGDRAAAIRLLRELEAARVDPHHLLVMLHRQLRLLVMAADLLARGTPASQLATELSVHPYVAQKLARCVRRLGLRSHSGEGSSFSEGGTGTEHFRRLYPRLLDLDRKLKSSRAPWQALMDLFVLEATTA